MVEEHCTACIGKSNPVYNTPPQSLIMVAQLTQAFFECLSVKFQPPMWCTPNSKYELKAFSFALTVGSFPELSVDVSV